MIYIGNLFYIKLCICFKCLSNQWISPSLYKGYSIWDLEGGRNEKKNMWGGGAEKLKIIGVNLQPVKIKHMASHS